MPLLEPLENYTVQQAAALTGLSEHTLRYYEKIGLSTPGGAAAVERPAPLQRQRPAQTGDTGLPERRRDADRSDAPLLRLALRGRQPRHRAATATGSHLEELHQRMAELAGHIKYGERKVDYWRAIEQPDEPAAAAIAREVDQIVHTTITERN